MTWSPNTDWLISADNGGIIKYWQANMNNLKAFVGHKDPIRGLSYVRPERPLSPPPRQRTWRSADVFDAGLIESRAVSSRSLGDKRACRFAPTSTKFASCSDDGIVKVWDFQSTAEEVSLKGQAGLRHALAVKRL